MPFPRRKREVEPDSGEAVKALPNDRYRAFVAFYLMEAPRRGAQTNACRRAGFGKPTSSDNFFQRYANKLMSDERIQRAILAEAKKMLRVPPRRRSMRCSTSFAIPSTATTFAASTCC